MAYFNRMLATHLLLLLASAILLGGCLLTLDSLEIQDDGAHTEEVDAEESESKDEDSLAEQLLS